MDCLYMQTILKKYSFKGTGRLSQLFLSDSAGSSLSSESNIPQNKSYRVSDPAEQNPAQCHNPRNEVLEGIRPIAELCTYYTRRLFCGAWYPAEQSPAGTDSPPYKALRSIKPHGTKTCWISNPRETTFEYKYLHEFEPEFKNILGCEFTADMRSIHQKNQRSRPTVPLRKIASTKLGLPGWHNVHPL